MTRQFRQDLSALFGSMGQTAFRATPLFSTFVAWICATFAYYAAPLATKGGYADAVAAALVFYLAVLFLAYRLGRGAFAFLVDAQRSCLPGSQGLARRARFLAPVLLLPALVPFVIALAGSPLWRAWVPTVAVLAIAVTGVLAPLLPISAVGLFMLVVLAVYWAAIGRTVPERGMELIFALFSAALALPVVATWRQLTRRGSSRPIPAGRLRTICIRIAPRGVVERASWRATTRLSSGDRQLPVQIIRTCLGRRFVLLSAWHLIVGAVLLTLLIVSMIGLPWLGARGGRWAVSILALAAAGLVPSGLLTQISKLTHAQIAELALMPGLGAPAAQRRALCSVILLPPLLWLGIVLLLGSAGLLLEGEPLSSICVLAACVLVIWLFYTVRSLQTLAKRPQRRGSFTFEFLLLYFWVYWVYLELSLLQAHHGYWWVWHWFGWLLIAVGVLISASIAIGMGYVVRRFATAPHPFLS